MLQKPYLFIFLGYALIASFYLYEISQEKIVWHPAEKEAIKSLLTLYDASWKWKELDPDGNRIKDFWTRDIAGLYFYPNFKTGKKIKLISQDLALSDFKAYPEFYHESDRSPIPHNGYFLHMMDKAESGFFLAEVDPATGLKYRNPLYFGIIAHPALNKRMRVFILNEKKHIYYKQAVDAEDVDK